MVLPFKDIKSLAKFPPIGYLSKEEELF